MCPANYRGFYKQRLRWAMGWEQVTYRRFGTLFNSTAITEWRKWRTALLLTLRYWSIIIALIAIGGDGTLQGATHLAHEHGIAVVGCPGTIDNDLMGTDYTIGFSTAVQTAVEAVDKIRDTASSHDRMFLVEVMGRHSGYIALYTAMAAGADVVAIPETNTNFTRNNKFNCRT